MWRPRAGAASLHTARHTHMGLTMCPSRFHVANCSDPSLHPAPNAHTHTPPDPPMPTHWQVLQHPGSSEVPFSLT